MSLGVLDLVLRTRKIRPPTDAISVAKWVNVFTGSFMPKNFFMLRTFSKDWIYYIQFSTKIKNDPWAALITCYAAACF